jgi:hypothetical protein
VVFIFDPEEDVVFVIHARPFTARSDAFERGTHDQERRKTPAGVSQETAPQAGDWGIDRSGPVE